MPDAPASPAPVPFWRRPTIQWLAPFLTSAAFHVGIVGTGYVLFKTATVFLQPTTREQIVIPDTNLVENADNGGVANPGINDDPTRSGAQNVDENVRDSNDWATKKTDSVTQNLMRGSADVAAPATPIGLGASTGGAQVSGLNTKGLGDAAEGNLAPFGPPGGGAGQGKGLFGIAGGNVKRVVYICDASGSLVGTTALTLIKRELAESIGRLQFSQAFSVIFFRGTDSPPEILLKTEALETANSKNKSAAYDMIEKLDVHGNTDPRPSLRIAFTKMQPQMIFLLVDGVESTAFTFSQLQAELDSLNKDRKVRLTVIVVGDASEADLAPWRELATSNGGDLRRVTRASR